MQNTAVCDLPTDLRIRYAAITATNEILRDTFYNKQRV